MIRVEDYSTDTGLRVRISCDTTGTAVQMPADEWHELLEQCKAGCFDPLALEPNIPFVHWEDGHKYPGQE